MMREGGSVVVEDGRIADVLENSAPDIAGGDRVIDAEGLYLSPGFVDIHVHGADGADVMDGSVEDVCRVCRAHMRQGTTSIVPTALSCKMEELMNGLGIISKTAGIIEDMPEILGIHLEGPYFSKDQAMAQDPKYIKDPVKEEYEMIFRECPSIIRWSAAPERPGALEMGRWMKNNGIVASIGHSNAVYEDVVEACENGYSMVTHLFNGMSKLTRKNAIMRLGVAESGLALDELTVEIIADGMHLPPGLLKLIYKTKGAERISLSPMQTGRRQDVTESILGSKENGQRIEIADGVAYMPGRTSFAGSVATTDRLVRTMYKMADVPVGGRRKNDDVVPARMMGAERAREA
jgi:N-acetylglucosamine-6-phosphate deacetylase